jgi:flavin reductase (DIM6/NTAB) family NADH-FMN oxidoreductase RutF
MDGERLRAVARLLPAAVTVLVALDGPVPYALTANSFVTLSLDPPLVAVSVGDRTRMAGVLRPGTDITASVLGAGQGHVARWFADPARPRGAAALGPFAWRAAPGTPCPVLAEAVAFFAGTVRELVPVGDHVLVVAETHAAAELAGEIPLLHWRGGFTRPGPGWAETAADSVAVHGN